MLSGNAERLPLQAWDINMRSLLNIPRPCKRSWCKEDFLAQLNCCVWKDHTEREYATANYLEPNTVYGINKLAGERWCEYYVNRYGLDIRSLRYPGLISYKTEAGGGTTDYAMKFLMQ
ncbi:MAG: NAD-dependent epimerase/dehydratase family protein [Ignavibacteria bacterium]|nr:NAD-dependent epimerase/dehydratase family protein [Ignavibacteria bacterium]